LHVIVFIGRILSPEWLRFDQAAVDGIDIA
jgi:hypothetical protein